jgi:hypothetical protein
MPGGTSPATAGAVAPAGSGAPLTSPPKDAALTGYGYGKHASGPSYSSGTPHAGRLAHHASEAVATFTGFEMLGDGGSRIFVQLSRQVDVGQAKGPAPAAAKVRRGKHAHAAQEAVVSTLTYVLHGTEVVQRNNENALVTLHFNTPIARARLVPAGRDLRLVLELRADAAPTMNMVPTKDNGAMLQLDFPAGSYLPPGTEPPPDATATLPSGVSGGAASAAPAAPAAASGAGGAAPQAMGTAAATPAPTGTPEVPGSTPAASVEASGSRTATDIPPTNATFASAPPHVTTTAIEEDEEFRGRFRWGITPMGGPIVGSLSGGAGGLDARFGMQVSNLFGLYAQPVAAFGITSISQPGNAVEPAVSTTSGLTYYGVGALADFTFFDTLFLAAGPEVLSLSISGTTTTVGNQLYSLPGVSQTDFAIAGRVGIVIGKKRPTRRKGFTLAIDAHTIFPQGGSVFSTPMLALGYESF